MMTAGQLQLSKAELIGEDEGHTTASAGTAT
jgi:hypothetical protein